MAYIPFQLCDEAMEEFGADTAPFPVWVDFEPRYEGVEQAVGDGVDEADDAAVVDRPDASIRPLHHRDQRGRGRR
jgi:hypothetical protein